MIPFKVFWRLREYHRGSVQLYAFPFFSFFLFFGSRKALFFYLCHRFLNKLLRRVILLPSFLIKLFNSFSKTNKLSISHHFLIFIEGRLNGGRRGRVNISFLRRDKGGNPSITNIPSRRSNFSVFLYQICHKYLQVQQAKERIY